MSSTSAAANSPHFTAGPDPAVALAAARWRIYCNELNELFQAENPLKPRPTDKKLEG
jgi:hypothetical protein